MIDEIHRSYRVLELEPGASLQQVKQAYRDLAKVWHPDRFPNDSKLQNKAQERLKEVNLAYGRLEKFLTTSGPSSSHSPEPQKEQTHGGKGTQSEDGEPPSSQPPQSSDSSPQNEPTKFPMGFVWVIVAFFVIVILILVNSGGNSNRSQSPVFVPPVSKALDEKNGFKDFKFGMTTKEARGVLAPSDTTYNSGANEEVFNYRRSPANLIGDYATDLVRLKFFEGLLYGIDLYFSTFGNEIFESLKINNGEPYDSENWTDGNETWRAKSWRGEKIACSILARPSRAWDNVVIYDIEANKRVQDYTGKEPERASKDFGLSGFKSLVMGMKLQDLTVDYFVLEENKVTDVKKVTFGKGDWLTVGFFPITTLYTEFFKDRLYRIDLGFEANRKEMFETFKQRFGLLQDNDTWTRGSMKLKAKSAANDKLVATILAPNTSVGNQDNWDAIVLLDVSLWREAEQFKQDAPKRAAKNF